MRRVFVTGAEGFVGKHLVQYLRQSGYEVVAGVRNRARKLAYERQQVAAIVCDITDSITVARAIASVRPDSVLHLAGMSRPALAADEPLEAYQSIVTAWANVLDAVRRTVPRARVLLISAADVYGNAGRDGRRLNETTPSAPVSTFGSLKATAESIAGTYFRDYHLNLTIARPFGYTGPGQGQHFFLGAIAQRLARSNGDPPNAELELPDLSCRRDWLHVEDVVVAYEALLRAGRPNEVYNVCSGEAVPCRDIIQAMLQKSGCEYQLTESPLPEDDVHVPVLCGDNTKLRVELDWEPRRTVYDAVDELVTSYRTQPVTAAR